MAAAACGAWSRKTWGWRLAIAIFTVNGLGDLVQAFSGHTVEGILGVVVAGAGAGALVYWLTLPRVKAAFDQ